MRLSLLSVLISVIVLIQLVLSIDLTNAPSNVVELTDDNFEEFTSQGQWLIDIYAPWCQHCVKLAPTILETARLIEKKPDSKVMFGFLDATVHTNVKHKFGVAGYPTIFHYHHGFDRKFKGPRTVDGFLSFLEDMNRPAVEQVSDVEHVLSFTTDDRGHHQVALLYLGSPTTSLSAFQHTAQSLHGSIKCLSFFPILSPSQIASADDVFNSLVKSRKSVSEAHLVTGYSSTLPDIDMSDISNNINKLVQKLNITASSIPRVLAISPSSRPNQFIVHQLHIDDSEVLSAEQIEKWVQKHQLPLVSTLSASNFDTIMHYGKPAAIFISKETPVDPSHPLASSNTASIQNQLFISVAEEFIDHFTFAYMDGSLFHQYLSQFGITTSMLPTILIMEYEDDLYYVPEMAKSNLDSSQKQKDFLTQVINNEIIAQATVAWYNPQKYVRMLEKFVQKNDSTTVIIVFSLVATFVVTLLMFMLYKLATYGDINEEVIKAEKKIVKKKQNKKNE